MITRKPYDREDLRIKKRDKVLEVGPGHNPTFRSNVIVEKYVETNVHRCGDLKIYPHQLFINAAGENLPFNDKSFDYVICNQVLEHADDPASFILEQCRVAKKGYMETPSLLGEFLFPKKSHKWIVLFLDNKLILFDKTKMPGNYENNYGELFLNYLPYQSLTYKLLWLTEGDIMLNRCEWADNIDFIVNPTEERYLGYFTKPWTRKMVEQLYPRRKVSTEIIKVVKALLYLVKVKVKTKSIKHTPLTLEEYMKIRNDSKHIQS